MKLITTSGIIIREKFVGENGKFIVVLTGDMGVIEISVKGIGKITSKNSSSTQLFAYSKLCFNQRGDKYYLNSSEPIHIFYGLRLDVSKFSLASYMSEVISYSVTSNENTREIMRLFLNTLYLLSKGKRSNDFIKAVFELRFIADIGMMPDLLACRDCMKHVDNTMYFLIDKACLLCNNCYSGEVNSVNLNEAQLHTLRYIELIEFEKLWSFKISDEIQSVISYISENYLKSHLGRNFKTLDFYHTITGSDNNDNTTK